MHSLPLVLLCAELTTLVLSFQITILHTNDVHARVEQSSRDSGKCGNPADCYGGVARRFTKVKEIRANQQNVLLLDGGDQFQGTIWFNVYAGMEAAHFMNDLAYDAMALGNHEFDNGLSGLVNPFLTNVKFPILSANIKADSQIASNISGYYQPYKILNVGGEQIAIVGYTSKETPVLSDPGPHLTFEDEIEVLQNEVSKVLTLGVNKVIALGHSGFETDKLIAQKVRGVDVVVGGHSNTFLYTGPPPSNDVPVGEYPFIVKSDDGRSVPVVQAYAFGKYLGYLNVTFDAQGNVLHSWGNPILLNSSIPEDPAVLAEVNKWKEQLLEYSAQEIGKTLVFLNGSSLECRFRECNMGNLICDAMISNNIRHPDEINWNHVSLCLMNGGGVRASIDERTSNGSITTEDLLSVLPFGGTFDLIEVKGSTLKRAFEHSVHRYGASTGEFLQVGGIRVVYNLDRKPWQRVVKLEAICTKCRVPKYVPVENDQVYKVALPAFLAEGGDGFTMLKNESLRHDSGDLDIAVVRSYIHKMLRVYPAVEGRIVFITEDSCRSSAHLTHMNYPLVSITALLVLLQRLF
ncbi:PREDICTED: 5'-nucleotidase isoform X1 [Nanorana parkeri]|uniref:5'-nucleotidase isoform X1 n=1 Tax=Nanorana parkeri TaxID=125878 RepID=UPI0008541EA3|nr:PREDICTED: 5'-nucleotidase isoform X1 [Nanorana parkeri]